MPYNSRRLSLEQAAEILRIPVAELKRLAVQNQIGFTQCGDRYYFTQDDLDSWVSEKIISTQSMKPAAQRKERKTLVLPDTSKPFLAELCSLETVSSALPGRSKPSVLRALTELAQNSGFVYDPNDLYDELLEREEIATTTIENGAAIPHPHHRFEVPIFDESFICVAKLLKPIFYGNSPDGEKTDIFFLVCCLDSNLHIQAIARLCQLCQDTSLLRELREAETDEEMYNVLIDTDQSPELHPIKQSLDEEEI